MVSNLSSIFFQPQIVHVSLEEAPPQVHYAPPQAPPQLFHVKLQRVESQHIAPPAPPPQVCFP